MKLKILSTQIIISYLFICVIALCIVLDVFYSFLLCVFALILHEAGHIIPMCVFGCPPDKIKISLFEITISDKSRQQRSLIQNFIIIFSGPFVNFICFIIFFLLYLIYGADFQPFAAVNISLCLFNMLPVMSLDGGQLMYLLLRRKFSEEASEKAVNVTTFIFIFPLAALGFLVLFNSKYNFSLLFVCVYLVLSLLMRNNRYY